MATKTSLLRNRTSLGLLKNCCVSAEFYLVEKYFKLKFCEAAVNVADCLTKEDYKS